MKVLKFYTETCMPCKVLTKVLNKIEGLEVEPINALEDVAMVDKYEVCTTPTLIFLKDDKEVARTHGMQTENKIREIMKEFG